MKKYLFGLFAIALAVGFSAFTHPAKKATTGTFYYWFTPAGAYQGFNERTNGLDGQLEVSGCDGATTVCQRAYDQSQLADPDDPSAGLISNPTPVTGQEIFVHE
jgi:hypothetical protein